MDMFAVSWMLCPRLLDVPRDVFLGSKVPSVKAEPRKDHFILFGTLKIASRFDPKLMVLSRVPLN